MGLFFREEGIGEPVIILHGLFGMSDNWLTIARKLSESYRVILPDQRNHGKSFHDEVWNYAAMVQDLADLVKKLRLEKFILVGHSMGGKVAMNFAQQFPDLLEKLVVIDIAPRYYPVHHDTIIKALKSVKIDEITARAEAEDQLEKMIKDWGTRQFLMKNLGRSRDGFYWKFNIEVISNHIENVGEAIESTTCDVPGLFIRGSKSDYINEKDVEQIKNIFTNAYILTMKNAGHWVHADQPEAFLATIKQFFDYERPI